MKDTNFYGKYRGVVTDISDPLCTARIKAKVPDVYGTDESGWALPCVPFAGEGFGMCALPAVGSWVWIEFEQGDPDYPIWSGCFWGTPKEPPAGTLLPPYKKLLLKTSGGNKLTLDDTPGVGGITLETQSGEKLVLSANSVALSTKAGHKLELAPAGIALETPAGQKLQLGPAGITISSGGLGVIKVTQAKVDVNSGALEVT